MKHWDTAAYLWEKFTYEKRVYKLKLEESRMQEKAIVESQIEYSFDLQSAKFKQYDKKMPMKELELFKTVNYRGVTPVYANAVFTAKGESEVLNMRKLQDRFRHSNDICMRKYLKLMDKHLKGQPILADFPQTLIMNPHVIARFRTQYMYCIVSNRSKSHATYRNHILYKQFVNIQQTYKNYGNFDFKCLESDFTTETTQDDDVDDDDENNQADSKKPKPKSQY
jgi:hypothetical protein